MASYLDQIPQFKEYVPQLPLDTLMKAGIYKQEKYEQNVQKIQEEMEKVAGLDIYKDVDKKYLQSKLDELGGKLRMFAGGDFSNFQLANSVSGMTKQIIRDEKVQNAVSSTAFYRKEKERIKKLDDEGKGNPANTLRFNKGVNSWVNDPNAGVSFNTAYITPIDVWGKIKDIAKEVGVDESDVQNLWQTDERGNTLYDTDKYGNKTPKWNPIMAEKILKGKDAGKILQAFQTALTPADYQQLAINGEYEKASATPEMLRKEIIDNSSEQLTKTNETINNIKIAIVNEEQKNDKDENKINSLKNQLEYFQKSFNSLVASRDNSIKAIGENPDAVRGALYTNNYLFTMSQKLSSHEETIKYSVSPIFTVTMEQNKFNREIQRDKIQDFHWAKEQQLREAAHSLNVNKYQLEVAAANQKANQDRIDNWFKYKIGTPPPGYTGLGEGVRLPIPTDDPNQIKHGVEDQFSSSVSALNDLNYKLTLQYFKEANKKAPGETDAQFEDRMRNDIYKYATGNKESVDINSGAINSYTARFAAKQIADWNKNPNNVPAEFRGLIGAQKDLLKTTTSLQQQMNEVRIKAYEQARVLGLTVPSPEQLQKNVKPTTINIPGIGAVNLSSQDVMDLAASTPSAFNAVFNSKEEEQEAKRAGERLRLKYGDALFGKIYNEVFSEGIEGGISVANSAVAAAGNFKKHSNYNALAKIESQLYIKSGIIKQPISQPILRGKENKDDVNERVSAIIAKYRINETPGFDQEDFQQTLLSNDNRTLRVNSYPGITPSSPTTYTLNVTSPKTGKTTEVTIDKDDYKFIMGVNPPTNVGVPETISILNRKSTTNLSGGRDASSTWFSSSDFKNLEKNVGYTVTGDLVNDEMDANKVWMKLYIHHNDGRIEPITYPEPFSKTNEDGSYNTKLDYLPLGINNTVIKQIKRK